MFMEVLVLMVIVLTIFSLFALQAYQGVFSQSKTRIGLIKFKNDYYRIFLL